jgi:preprotein translocase, YajC subunit
MKQLLQLSPLIVMMIFFYLIIFIPESKRKKKYKAMLNNLKVNDEIMTKGGIIGKIINIQERAIVVQTGPDKVKIKVDKTGVLNLLSEVETLDKADKSDNKKEA